MNKDQPIDQYQNILGMYMDEYKVKEVAYRVLCQNSLPIIIQTVCGRKNICDVQKLDEDDLKRLYYRFPVLVELGSDFGIMKYQDLRIAAEEICKGLGILEYSELIVALL